MLCNKSICGRDLNSVFIVILVNILVDSVYFGDVIVVY